MKKIIQVLLGLVLLTSCTTTPKKTKPMIKKSTPQVTLTRENHSVSIPGLKEENVNVKTDAYGEVESIKEEVLLSQIKKSDLIEDKTNLTEIKNKKGNENYVLKNQSLLWENKNETISYSGISHQALPIQLKVSYYLNDKLTRIDDLVNQSGHIKIRFDYTNTASTNKNNHTIYVPFTCLTILTLNNQFTNVHVKNGKVSQYNNQNMIMGMALPGLTQSLNNKDIEIPDYVEIEADTTKFQLDFSATIVTPGITEALKDKHLNSLEEAVKGLQALNKGATQLVSGTSQIVKASHTLEKYFNQYFQTINSMTSQVNELLQSLSQEKSYKELKPYIYKLESLKNYLSLLKSLDLNKLESQIEKQALSKIESLDLTEDQKKQVKQTIVESISLQDLEEIKSLKKMIGQLQVEMPQVEYKDLLKQVQSTITNLQSGVNQLNKSGNTLNQQYHLLTQSLDKLYQGITVFNKEGINKLTKTSDYKETLSRLRELKQVDNDYDHFSGKMPNQESRVKFIIETEKIK